MLQATLDHEQLTIERKRNLLEVQKLSAIMMECNQSNKECQTEAYLLKEYLDQKGNEEGS